MRLRGTFVSLALVLGAAPVVAGPAPFACAGEGPDATLVIDTGSSEQFLCVALDSSSVSGIRLIELASEQHGFSYSLGYQGQAVCMLDGVGSEEEECFEGGQPFWGYWRANSSGGWTWSGTGAGGTSVEDGDVEGWSYGTGSDGSSHQAPPTTTHEAVCGPEPSEGGGGDDGGNPKPDKPRGGGDRGDGGNATDKPNKSGPGNPGRGNDSARAPGRGTSAPGGSAGDSADQPVSDGERKERSKKKRKDGDDRKTRPSGRTANATFEPVVSPAPSPDVSPEAASASSGSTSDGPPLAGIAGLLIAILLAAAGAWFLKRKHAPTR